ncbi:MAG TPA: sulfate adenylyltransferase subunit CysN [Candidatus Avibacteroides excrementipullorum]|jgi:sulfate adenylyltransferase subunit 1|nr:sulfate adenylyltransferase subunit CysN [Candidatus Avibacteroides excrementipullorum]
MEQKIDIKTFLDNDEKKDLLRFLTAGSVDDGKSTLIGRLLFDSKKIYEDQLDALERDSKRVGNAGDHIDYALLLDGLKAEREQGITIDVAYRYFSTNKRKFIIADTPGHEQYTRNMITGGSTANLAVILVDARTGVITQTKRHSFLVSLLGIKHVVLAVNKMDLVDFSEERFNEIVTEYKQFVSKLNIPDVQYIPLSALEGDNVVKKSDRTPWYKGKSLLDFLETVEIGTDQNFDDFRYPVQYVLRPNLDFRGFSAKVASGVVHKGDEVMVLPSMKKTKVKEIVTYDGNLDYAFPPQSVTLTLEDEIDISRGDMLVHPDNLPLIGRTFEAMLVWMDEEDMDVNKQFFIKQTTNTSRVRIDGIRYKVDVNTMSQSKVDKLKLNEIGRAVFTTNRPLYFDPYVKNKSCGAFILIDPITNNTSAVGMIIDKADLKDLFTAITDEDKKKMISGESLVSSAEWKKRLEQDGKVFWITGEDKSYVRLMVYTLERRLYDIGKIAVILNLDSTGIEGMTPRDVALMAHKLSNRGIIVICCGSELSMANAREEFVKFRIVGDADAEKPLSDEKIVDEKNVISVIEDLIEKI